MFGEVGLGWGVRMIVEIGEGVWAGRRRGGGGGSEGEGGEEVVEGGEVWRCVEDCAHEPEE